MTAFEPDNTKVLLTGSGVNGLHGKIRTHHQLGEDRLMKKAALGMPEASCKNQFLTTFKAFSYVVVWGGRLKPSFCCLLHLVPNDFGVTSTILF